MKNLEVAALLNKIADILELQGVDFKPYAYRKAALGIESLSEDIEDIYHQNKLKDIPGVGESIAQKIAEFLEKGKLDYYEKLQKEVKVNIAELSQVPFLGPKKINVLYTKLGIKNIKELEQAAKQHKIHELSGFGEETEKKILEGIQFLRTNPKRFLYAQAAPIVAEIKQKLGHLTYVQKIEVAGSFRRGKETVGDLDFAAVSDEPEKLMKFFTTLPEVKEILAQGPTKSSVRLSNGLQIDLRVFQEKEFGSAMNYFTGNKEHNIELRKLALSQGYTLSEYGLFKVKGKKWVAGRNEEDIYQKMGLLYMEPEIRENMGEIQAALNHKLPNLVNFKDIKGVFHCHSDWSDGNNTLLEMAQEAERLGLKFISFNDHFGPIGITNPLTEKRLAGYLKEIEKIRKKVGIRVFSGVEIDILKDGSLPLKPSLLKQLDIVLASVHVAQNLPEAEMTKRVCSALENYPINILGHPTGRLLNERKEIALNLETVFETAKKNHVFLEINSLPQRMDLNGANVKSGLNAGCQFALSVDAHDLNQIKYYNYGLLGARRGWLEKKDLLNCWDLKKIEKILKN